MTIGSDNPEFRASDPDLDQSEIAALKTRLRQQLETQAQLDRLEEKKIHAEKLQAGKSDGLSDLKTKSDKKILSACLLCFLFGFFAVHKFYAGRFVDGVSQLAIVLGGGFVWYKYGLETGDISIQNNIRPVCHFKSIVTKRYIICI